MDEFTNVVLQIATEFDDCSRRFREPEYFGIIFSSRKYVQVGKTSAIILSINQHELRIPSYITMSLRLSCLFIPRTIAPCALADPPSPKAPPEFSHLKYRSIGPAAGGRVCRVAGIPGDPFTYYAATAGGGVWKSEDGGITFNPIFDEQPASSVGSIAVSPSDPNVVYVGRGRQISEAMSLRGTGFTNPRMPGRPGNTSGSKSGTLAR